MKRRIIPTLILMAAALTVLSACNIVIGPVVPTQDATVTATSSRSVLDGESLASGESFVYKIQAGSISAPLIYFELSSNQKLTVMDGSGHVLAYSSDPSFFTDNANLLASVAGVSPAAIGTAPTCAGSCVIVDASSGGPYYAEVQGSGSYDFYAYGMDYYDASEPSNDGRTSATSLPMDGSSVHAAIETLRDSDFWKAPVDGQVAFRAKSGNPIDLKVLVRSPGGSTYGPYSPGSGTAIQVYQDWTLEVYANGDDLAGPASASEYFLYYSPAP